MFLSKRLRESHILTYFARTPGDKYELRSRSPLLSAQYAALHCASRRQNFSFLRPNVCEEQMCCGARALCNLLPLLSAWVRANANGCEKYVLPSSIFSLWGGQAASQYAVQVIFTSSRTYVWEGTRIASVQVKGFMICCWCMYVKIICSANLPLKG